MAKTIWLGNFCISIGWFAGDTPALLSLKLLEFDDIGRSRAVSVNVFELRVVYAMIGVYYDNGLW